MEPAEIGRLAVLASADSDYIARDILHGLNLGQAPDRPGPETTPPRGPAVFSVLHRIRRARPTARAGETASPSARCDPDEPNEAFAQAARRLEPTALGRQIAAALLKKT